MFRSGSTLLFQKSSHSTSPSLPPVLSLCCAFDLSLIVSYGPISLPADPTVKVELMDDSRGLQVVDPTLALQLRQ